MSGFLFSSLISLAMLTSSAAATARLAWDELPPMPPSPGETVQPGLAGPFAGVHRDALLVGGGANFSGKMPWDGGVKTWWDDLFVLERKADGTQAWVTDKHFKLPRRLAYGMSFSTPDGVVCAGGSDAAQCFADVFLLSWDPVARAVTTSPLPALPRPLAFMGGAILGRVIYVVAGQETTLDATGTTDFWSLDLAKRDQPAEFKWRVLPGAPGPGRILPVVAGQSRGGRDYVYLFSGRSQPTGRRSLILGDAYAFDPRTEQWKTLSATGPAQSGPGLAVMAGSAAPGGKDEVLIFSGDRGELFLELETHDLEVLALRAQLASAADTAKVALQVRIDAHLDAKKKIYLNHPGFSREVISYDTQRDTWQVIGTSPGPGQVTTVAVPWGEAIVIPGGEIRPATRTTVVTRVVPK